jgi:argininosuccinate lyase
MKLWAGRFGKDTDCSVDKFLSSFTFDIRMCEQDITGSLAHAAMLRKQGILSSEDEAQISEGLHGILQDIRNGAVSFLSDAEDIHMFIEKLLTERIGIAGMRLHTGRSRNDQVALDFRMYAKTACAQTIEKLKLLCETLLTAADQHLCDIMPGFTHLQIAQPVSLGHHLMAYFQMFGRDITRFRYAYKSADVMPLGSGALATTTYPIDREFVAEQLGFSAITENSMDAVGDRDFALEYLSASAICMMHLSRFCEEIVVWASSEFKFVTIDDAYATGSSMMPQKKNPDVAELVRGKTGRVYGDLFSLLTVMKGIPMAYNRDMQEDKEAFFDAQDTLIVCLTVFTGMLNSMKFHTDILAMDAQKGFSNATDCADYLVRRGVPFRTAHEITGKLVAHCLTIDYPLECIPLDVLKSYSPVFEEDIYHALSADSCLLARNIRGGPSPEQVKSSIIKGRDWLSAQ